MVDISRRHVLKLSLLAGGIGLAVPFGPGVPSARAQAGPLRVTHFGGPYAALEDIIGAPFTAAGNGEVEYEQDQPSLILSKWQAQPDDPAYDIGLFERPMTIRAGSAGLALPMSAAEMPSLANALPGAIAEGGFGVALAFDTIDIMYDKTQVSEPITSWLDLWRPDLAGKIMLPGMPIDGAIIFLLVSAARAAGHGDDVEAVIPKFVELKNSVRSFYSDPNQATQLLERGEIAAAVQYSARIGQLIKRDPSRFARATPTEGVPAIPYDLVIASGTKNPDSAKKYVDFAVSPDIQAQVCSTILLNPSMSGVQLSDEVRGLIIADDSRMFAVNDALVIEKQQGWLERWQREVQS